MGFSPRGLLAWAKAHATKPMSQQFIDLSHPISEQTPPFPGDPAVEISVLQSTAQSDDAPRELVNSSRVAMCVHCGTHLDAPIHFSERGRSTADIPLEQLVAPAVVIDISAQAAKNRDYLLSAQDVWTFEKQHGRIARGTIVLLKTGWNRYWPDARTYLGDDTPGDASKLSFPGYGVDAAKQLVEERGVAALGIDTASIDYGRSTDFLVHRIAGANNVPGLENLTNLDQVPSRGATVVALPMKIEGGSGGPLRAIALVAR